MTLLETSARLEENADLHIARLLILIGTFSGMKGNKTVNGLTKLAKLDFLLRYPIYLERALEVMSVSKAEAEVKQYERQNIESTMVRYRYGPWDFRYRRFLNTLIGKGLVHVKIENRTTKIGITEKGLRIYTELIDIEDFQDFFKRAKLLKLNFNLSGTNLMKFIYKTFPEITTLRLGERIEYEY